MTIPGPNKKYSKDAKRLRDGHLLAMAWRKTWFNCINSVFLPCIEFTNIGKGNKTLTLERKAIHKTDKKQKQTDNQTHKTDKKLTCRQMQETKILRSASF